MGCILGQAHRDLASLASDILLYDRLVLPVPEDEGEYRRWQENSWVPEDIAKRLTQAGGLIIPVPWTEELRTKWTDQWEQLKDLGQEVAYGATASILASMPEAWATIAEGLQPDQSPERKPAILAGYQSEAEARAELRLDSVDKASTTSPRHQKPEPPGARPVDLAVALKVERIVHEPDLVNPEAAFLVAIDLALDETFQRARRRLFDLEDDLYVDGWEPGEVELKLERLEEEYRDAVKTHETAMRRRKVAMIMPTVGGWATVAAGHPHAKGVVSKSLSLVVGQFAPLPPPEWDPDNHPGAALALIRAAYRQENPLPD